MHALPTVVALVIAAPLAPMLLRALAAALVALIPLTLVARLASAELFYPELLPIAVYALGVIALRLVDDTLAEHAPTRGAGSHAHRGWRGHGAAALRGELSTGTLKAVGSLGLALLAMSYSSLSNWRWL